MQCNLERSEDKARWHVSKGVGQGYGGWGGISAGVLTMPSHPQLTLLLVLEDRLHRQLTYDLLPSKLTGPGGGLGLGRALAGATTHLSSLQPTVPRTSLRN